MELPMKFHILIFLSIVVALSTSCTKEDTIAPNEVPEILGKWELIDVQMPIYSDAHIYAKAIGSVFEFNNDNSYSLFQNDSTEIGHWTTTEKRLYLTQQNNISFTYDEFEVLDNNLYLTYYIPNDSSHLIYPYYEKYLKK